MHRFWYDFVYASCGIDRHHVYVYIQVYVYVTALNVEQQSESVHAMKTKSA